MNYTYRWTTSRENVLERTDEDGNIVYVGVDVHNGDYQEFQKWLAEGNTIADGVDPIPPS